MKELASLCSLSHLKYELAFSLHFIRFMAGFQFIALEGEINLEGNSKENKLELAIFSFRFLGFALSLSGSLVCLTIQSYLKGIQHERIETQVRGICKYAAFIQMGDYTAVAAFLCLCLSANILLWKSHFPTFLAITFNAFFFFGGVLFSRALYIIIMRRQNGRQLYADKFYIAAQKRNQSMSTFDKLKRMFTTFLW